jgi:branched-chain amino acid transport system ATP-binding protein
MTVFENVRNAIACKRHCSMRLFPKLDRISAISNETERILDLLRLTDIKYEVAGNLAYGQQRALELGLTMALDPEVVLLDEPTAGMTNEESSEIVELMRNLTESKTLVIIEHDIDVVFDLADRISVLHQGKIIATGTPDQIKLNEAVKEAYLGKAFDK